MSSFRLHTYCWWIIWVFYLLKLSMKHAKILDFLTANDIPFVMHEHAPFFTVAASVGFKDFVPGVHSKNLFLKDKKKTAFFLLSVPSDKKVDLRALGKRYGRGGLSFCNQQELLDRLDLTPGSVTPYGLINDSERAVQFLLDQDFLNAHILNFHPLENNKTIGVATKDFLRFCELVEHKPQVIEVPVWTNPEVH
jgi:Ala-tRNA(Pro) deacylase